MALLLGSLARARTPHQKKAEAAPVKPTSLDSTGAFLLGDSRTLSLPG